MKNIMIDDYIKTNSEISNFESIIEQLKEKINNNVIYTNNIYLYFKTLFNKKNKTHDKLLIHCFYKKNQKNKKEYIFDIILTDNYNYNIFPKIYCISLDIDQSNINLVDKRDLFISIMEKNSSEIIIKNIIDLLLDIIIIKIPEFVKKIFFYECSKCLIYYGKYYLNEIYNINDFIWNKNIYFYKVMTYELIKNKEYNELNMKYIIISDFHVLFFDLIENSPKNICKLFFIGNIYNINSFERLDKDKNEITNNDEINISNNKIYIDWLSDDNKEIKFIFSILYDKNNQENIPDFIDIVNKKQSFIRINYKLIMKDYNEYNKEEELNDIINLSNYLEKKEKFLNKQEIYIKELNKIYQKIIDISTSCDKKEISLKYKEKMEKINKDDIYNKRIYFHSFDKNDYYMDLNGEKKDDKKNNISSLLNFYEEK